MLYSFDDANSRDRHKIQYFKMFGNRGVYFDGWFAGTVHKKARANAENTFSGDETANVGLDKVTMVTDDYDIETSRFNAKIDKVTINLK